MLFVLDEKSPGSARVSRPARDCWWRIPRRLTPFWPRTCRCQWLSSGSPCGNDRDLAINPIYQSLESLVWRSFSILFQLAGKVVTDYKNTILGWLALADNQNGLSAYLQAAQRKSNTFGKTERQANMAWVCLYWILSVHKEQYWRYTKCRYTIRVRVHACATMLSFESYRNLRWYPI